MAITTAPIADIAWAAGLFEGEGCVGYAARKPYMGLVSTDRDVVEKFAAVVGLGKLEVNPRPPNRPGSFAKKPQWVWKATSFESVQALIAAFWHWLGERRRAKRVSVLTSARNAPLANKYRSYMRRGICGDGHAMTPENTYTNPAGRSFCRACRARRMHDIYERRKAAGTWR